jgi:hypothetical protein
MDWIDVNTLLIKLAPFIENQKTFENIRTGQLIYKELYQACVFTPFECWWMSLA